MASLSFLFITLTLPHSVPDYRSGSGPSEPDSELPGGGGARAQRLVSGEEGVESEDATDFDGGTCQHGGELCPQNHCRG